MFSWEWHQKNNKVRESINSLRATGVSDLIDMLSDKEGKESKPEGKPVIRFGRLSVQNFRAMAKNQMSKATTGLHV